MHMSAFKDIRTQLQYLSSIFAHEEKGKLYKALDLLLNSDMDIALCNSFKIYSDGSVREDASALYTLALYPKTRIN